MNVPEALAVANEVKRRVTPRELDRNVKRKWRFIQDLHAMQEALRSDPRKLKAALAGRRAGKTTLAAALMLEVCGDLAGGLCVFLALTRKSAKRTIWRELKRFNRRYSLGLEFNETDQVCTLRNGSQIWVVASNNESDIDRLRGSPFLYAIIDEAASFGDYLETLYRAVLRPSMLDYDGTVLLMGTPNPTCEGFFYEITRPEVEHRKKGWSVFEWCFLDNPYLQAEPGKREPVPNQKAQKWLDGMMEEEELALDDPWIQREYFSKWVPSSEEVCYAFTEKKNTFTELPRGRFDWQYGLSIDIGYDDPTAMVLFQWADGLPDLYVPWMKTQSGMIPATIAAEVKRLQKMHDLAFVVVDQGGGAGKIITEEFIQRYQIHAKGAEKQKKTTYIGFANGDLRTGKVKIHSDICAPLIKELKTVQWDKLLLKRGRFREDPRYPNDCADAFLYGWREARHYYFTGDDEPAELAAAPGSRESQDRVEQQMEQQAMRRAAKKDSEEWWEP